MEAVEKTLTYQDDTGLYSKLLPDKDKCHAETTSDESNYVDLDDLLDMKSGGTKTVQVTFTGEGNQLAVIKCDSGTSKTTGCRKSCDNEDKIISEDFPDPGEHLKGKWTVYSRPVSGEIPLENSLAKIPCANLDFEHGELVQSDPDLSDCSENACSESDDLQYTDVYLSSKTGSDDGADLREVDRVEDESHYITTHEIQLTELDHDVDYDTGRGTYWDFEDDNLVYSFVDYASFESDETREGTLILEGRSLAKGGQAQCTAAHQLTGEAAVGTEQDSDVCDSDKRASSDESDGKNQSDGGNPAGKIHLSIKTSSRAVNESNSVREDDNICGRTKHVGDGGGHFFFTSADGRGQSLCDRAQYFIPAPGRQHLATKLRGKDINEYSSGTSSSISELDDADKEVRNLTAKSFRSLACPYFDAINLSTSSESSVSEYGLGLNKWSAFVDLNYGKLSQPSERDVVSHRSSHATLDMSKTAERKNRHGKAMSSTQTTQNKMCAMSKKMAGSKKASSSSQKIELKAPTQTKQSEVITLTETLNFRCNVDVDIPEGARRPKCSKNVHGSRFRDEVTSARPAKSRCEMQYQYTDTGDGMGDTHKRAIFASSLLKNVISKKMQFEQERKMERGEIRDTYPAVSPCVQCKEQEVLKEKSVERALNRQSSETGSGVTVNSVSEHSTEGSRPNSCEPAEEQKNNNTLDDSVTSIKRHIDKKDVSEPPKGELNRSQNSAFKSWKEGEPEAQQKVEDSTVVSDPTSKQESTTKEELDSSGMSTKMSQLFVPGSKLLSKENNSAKEGTPALDPSNGRQMCDKETNMDINRDKGMHAKEENEKGAKTPEIKIRLRSVKENKGYTLNIANLLTPKISYNPVHALKTTGDSKWHVLPASDKIPHFTVRDIRDTKCKIQAPIYHVRDVRKLVKSSYRFVSLDNSEHKCSSAISAVADVHEGKGKNIAVMQSITSPIVIKCHSVKTNCNVKPPTTAAEASSQKQVETGRSSPKVSPEATKCETKSSHWTASRVAPVLSKQLNPDQTELAPAIETKLAKQRPEMLISETSERKSESKIPKQAALEKLKAAVRTMEQLYVFDRNEWKRKTQAPQPVADSHVLSLIAREEQGAEELGTAVGINRLTDSDITTGSISQTFINTPKSGVCKAQEDKGSLKIIHIPYNEDKFKVQSQQGRALSNQSTLHFGTGDKIPVSISSLNNNIPQSSRLQSPSTMKSLGSKTPVSPLSLKIAPLKSGQVAQGEVKSSPTDTTAAPANSDSENYLAIPGQGYTSEIKLLNPEETQLSIVYKKGSSGVSQADTKRAKQSLKRTPFVMETQSIEGPSTTIYHHSPTAIPGPQPQVFCFSPSVPNLSPSPSVGGAVPQTQRKMLLDPSTGHYYLVDTPIQATTKRLFDPETGQYVDVPMPHSPVAPVTPVPMSVSPLTLSPRAYAPTYMVYPGFISSPTLSAQTAYYSGAADPSGEQGKHSQSPWHVANAKGAESPYYSTTGEAAPEPKKVPMSLGHVTTRGNAAGSDRKPVISITTQQGPRIIAPPSFDGTTMSFVVEHR
ncbi:uncharacterized protein C4orf54-like [Lampris incognitus]|uniref:uncharacterized protein C4orf54-like n=1 Tax=Lampris incognitus TaxID=2546036 RepID=UPI0024B4E32E|nr:uncharacterized protein C4orf54-like [Lampris incognitus]